MTRRVVAAPFGQDSTNLASESERTRLLCVFDANGRFYVMFARADLPKIAASNPMKTTPEENKSVMEGSIAYFGTYTVDEAGKSISLRVEASTFPNQVGSEQKRTITSIAANDLQVSNPNASAGGQINYVMKRATTVAVN